jgi:CRISPR system Cascade subunit CasC
MMIELHMLQNFAPSNLNSDDTGSPKDCEFGGHRRARISSQSLKRAMRTEFKDRGLIDSAHLAERTKRAVEAIGGRLVERGKSQELAQRVATAVLNGIELKVSEGKTQYLLFLGQQELDGMAQLCLDYWDALATAVAAGAAADAGVASGRQKPVEVPLPAGLASAILAILNGGQAADIALFGRMIANIPEKNVDGACQVAHAISTNRVSAEFDFYTAVDDLRPEDTQGADMLGTVEFNSACFYRYANLDTTQLVDNLGGDADLARRATKAFLAASIAAIPTGKQNSMAAHNPPSLVMAVVREAGAWNLANAFIRPIRPRQDADLVQESITALDAYWSKLTGMYGAKGRAGTWVVTTEPQAVHSPALTRVNTIDDLIERVLQTAVFQPSTRGR